MTLRVLVFYIIPAFLIMFGVGLLLLSRAQKKHVLRSRPDHRNSLKDLAE